MNLSIITRMKEYILRSEWSANLSDARGPRCPQCMAEENPGKHNDRCVLDQLCKDIRASQGK